MKIGPSPDLPANASLVAQAATTKEKAASAVANSASGTAQSKASSSSVSVSVSGLAKTLAKPEISTAADIDTDKVAAVKAAIEDGSYTVNAEAIADKLLSNAQEMLRRPV